MFLTYPAGLGVPTYGNTATCSLQGFFTQFGYAAGSYNLVLSIYYYLIINRGMKKEEFARVWEKVMHGIVIVGHLSFAIIGVSIGLFNPTPGFCYITAAPGYWCKSDNSCTKFANSSAWFYEVFAQGWIQVAYVGIVVTNTLIYLFVRKQEDEMKKYRHRGSLEQDQLSVMEKKSSYARSVFIQSIFYVGAFFLSWSWATIFHLVGWITGVSVPWITLLINTFLPLQGFFNAFIYARPRYLRLKKNNVHLSFKELVRLVFIPDDGSASRPRRQSSFSDSDESKRRLKSLLPKSLSRRRGSKQSSTLSSIPPASETGEAKAKTVKFAQDADEENGEVEEGKTANGNPLPAEEEKFEEGEQVNDVDDDEFIDSPSSPTSLQSDEENGKAGEGGTSNEDDAPAEEEKVEEPAAEEKVEEGEQANDDDKFLENPSSPTSSVGM